MPWFPDVLNAAELARRQTRADDRADPPGAYVTALARRPRPREHLARRGGHPRPPGDDPRPPRGQAVRAQERRVAGRAGTGARRPRRRRRRLPRGPEDRGRRRGRGRVRTGGVPPRADSPEYTHRGAAALRPNFARCFGDGGSVQLEHCATTDDGPRCALESNCVRWGDLDLPPEAGLMVCERGIDGRLAAVRLYDDIETPVRDA